MERHEQHHCRIAKQTILTTHPSGLQTRVCVELANFDCVSECTTSTKSPKKMWESPFLARRLLGSAHNTPVLGRRSDAVNEGRLSQQCTPVMRRRGMESETASPVLGRREEGEVDNSIISGWLKFRDNKRWKSRWGVVTKLSPAADCLHVQLYREPADRQRARAARASLSLQHFIGFESGFTLDREAHTLAILCHDLTTVLAFHSRETLISWQVKVGSQLGCGQEWVVVVPAAGGGSGGGVKLPVGPARLHLRRQRLALTSGTPPALLGVWDLPHLRRYGVVEGRFAWEGGARCGRGAGAYVVAADRAADIRRACDAALQPHLHATPSVDTHGGDKPRSSTRLSDERDPFPDTLSALYEEGLLCARGGSSPTPCYGDDRQRAQSCTVDDAPPWSGGADHVTLERCSTCLTKLGPSHCPAAPAAPLSPPPAHFNPAWTMEEVASGSDTSSNDTEYLTPRMIRKLTCHCNQPPQRPPKSEGLGGHELKKPPVLLPVADDHSNNPRVGPYENYDVPTVLQVDQVTTSELYDTPKKIRKALPEDLFQVTKTSSPGSLVLQKKCGCLLKLNSKKKPLVVECEETLQPAECPCVKVTNWANNLISLPYCRKDTTTNRITTEVLTHQKSEEMAIYATVDVSRKTKRQSSSVSEKDPQDNIFDKSSMNYQNLEPDKENKSEGPYCNYENLEFALSLEYYENAKDLLKRAGVTQSELDALSANIEESQFPNPKQKVFMKCKHSQNHTHMHKSDEYLLMEPSKDKRELCRTVTPNPGYTPMCPNPNWSQSLKYPLQKAERVDIEKSLSIPTLNGSDRSQSLDTPSDELREAMQKRSNSVDSTKILQDLKSFDNSICTATSSSLETLRNLAKDDGRECYECCKSSQSKSITSEGCRSTPPFRNKPPETARCVSMPGKAAGNRDSSSSNDSGVSSCAVKHAEYELASRHAGVHGRVLHASLPRKSRSSEPLRDAAMQLYTVPAKSSSAEAEVPVLPPKHYKDACSARSTSSGTSDLSDYMDTLSVASSHSDAPPRVQAHHTRVPPQPPRAGHQPTSTLRPRSGNEYQRCTPRDAANYTNLQ